MAPATYYTTCITTPGFEQHHGSSISVSPTTDYDAYSTAGLQQHQGSNIRFRSNNSMAPATDYTTCITTPWFEQHHSSSISVPPTTDYTTCLRAGLQQHHGSNISMAPTTDHTPYITTGLQQHDSSNISLAQIRDSVPTTTAMASKKESLPWLLSIVFTLLYFLYHLIQNWRQRKLEPIEQKDSAEEAEENLN